MISIEKGAFVAYIRHFELFESQFGGFYFEQHTIHISDGTERFFYYWKFFLDDIVYLNAQNKLDYAATGLFSFLWCLSLRFSS